MFQLKCQYARILKTPGNDHRRVVCQHEREGGTCGDLYHCRFLSARLEESDAADALNFFTSFSSQLLSLVTSSLLNFPSRWVFQRPQLRSVPRTIGRASTMAPWTPTDKPWLRCWFIVLVDGLVNKKRWKLRFFMLKIDPNCHHPFWGLGVSLFGTVFRSCFSFWKVVNLKFLSLLVCRRVQVVLSFTFWIYF